MKLGIYVIGTNAYLPLAIRFVKQFAHFYKGQHEIEFIIFSDNDPSNYLPEGINFKYFETHHSSWVEGTNSKFKNIIDNASNINVDHLYYFDADTNITEPFDDWFLGDLVAGEHYGNSTYMAHDSNSVEIYKKPFDRNPNSSCCLNESDEKLIYCYGAFFGGIYSNVLCMLSKLEKLMQFNKSQNYEPPVNDESYLNYYFNTHPVKIIKTSNFKFQVSCKGGLENTRDSLKNIDDLKYKLSIYKDYIIGLSNGNIIPISKFNMSDIVCYYINPDSYNFRKDSIENVVNILNFKKTKRISHCTGDDSKINRASIGHIFALNEAIKNNDFPLLLLEDDCKLIKSDFIFPDTSVSEATAIYLGGSLYPGGGGVYLEDYNADYFRVYNMLSAHAIYIQNNHDANVIKSIYEYALKNNTYIDLELAKKSQELIFLTPKKGPFFYQDDGLTRDVTLFEWTNHMDLVKHKHV